MVGTVPALAATHSYTSVARSGPETQTINLGWATLKIQFSAPTPVTNDATPDVYQEQKASVTLYGSGEDFLFSGTEYGYWEYNGTYAYRLSNAPYCEVSWGNYTTCDYNHNGAKIPSYMTWIMSGTTAIGDCYSIVIALWGSGKHTDETGGPGLCL
jgi:hypothetical protein